MAELNYSSLENAVAQLRKSFGYFHSDLALRDAGLREQFRGSTILAFERSFELAIEMIRSRLASIKASPSVLRYLDFADLMREAVDDRLILDPDSYLQYRELWNKVSHEYRAEYAEDTVASVDKFLCDMDFLIAALRKYSHGHQ